MDFITAKQAAEKWKMNLRSVQRLCDSRRIAGAERWGRAWMIPANAERPADQRRKPEPLCGAFDSLPRRSVYLIMTDLYRVPGSADAVLQSLADRPEAYALFDAQLAYHRGEIDRAQQTARALLAVTKNPIARLGCGMMQAYCAMYRGDIRQWREARRSILSVRELDENGQELTSLCLAFVSSAIYENSLFPEAFRRGCFDALPTDAYPAARYCYAQYLLTVCTAALKARPEAPSPHDIFHTFPQICELLISQSRAEGVILPELYLNLACASGYHGIGENDLAAQHIDRALALALPDRLYAPLAEYRRNLDFLLDERLERAGRAALREVRALNGRLMDGWTALHNAELGHRLCNELTTREREVAKLVALGLGNQEIAQRLRVSLSTVKQALRAALEKTGAESREEIIEYI